MSAAILAGAWLAPAAALALGLGLLRLGDGDAAAPVALGVALSLLAGAPAAALAAARGVVAVPMALAALGGVLLGGGIAGALLALDGPLVLGVALAAGGLAALWVGLAAARDLVRPLLLGLPLAAVVAIALGGGLGALHGLALGATVAAMLAAAPGAMVEPRLRAALPPLLLGLVAAGAVLAAPLASFLLGGRGVAPTLALLVALPGLGVLTAWPSSSPARLGTALLVLGAVAVGLALAVGSAPAVAGLIEPEALPAWRLSLLGAGFLPVLVALAGALAARGACRAAMAPLLLFGVIGGGAPFLLDGTALQGAEALAAPILGTALAAWLARRL